jgi:3-oxoadipate enol-lactonase
MPEYDVHGSGEPVVLVHGTTGSRGAWLMQVPVLSGRWQVVLPYYAAGDGPAEVDDLVGQVVAVVDELGLDRFHLAGWSLGAVVAAALAAGRPERVRSLALVSGWATSDAYMRFQFDLWRRLLADDPETFARYAITDGFTPAWFDQVGDAAQSVVPLIQAALDPGSDALAELDTRVDVSDRLASIGAPTLVVGGTHDRFVPVEHSRRLAELIPGARLVELDAGHLVVTERAEELSTLLADFFASAP